MDIYIIFLPSSPFFFVLLTLLRINPLLAFQVLNVDFFRERQPDLWLLLILPQGSKRLTLLLMPFLRSAFFTVALGIVSTLALSRAFSPSLTVKTSIGDASNDLDDGFQMLQNVTVIIATVTTCDETLILLNDPRGVLNALPVTGTFMIVDVESGSRRPLCGGIMVGSFFSLVVLRIFVEKKKKHF